MRQTPLLPIKHWGARYFSMDSPNTIILDGVYIVKGILTRPSKRQAVEYRYPHEGNGIRADSLETRLASASINRESL